MSFLAPAALALGALAIPILILYMLKLRRREVRVSSTLLWKMLLRDRQANAPWQRLRRNLLLLLQLLTLASLVLALARPAIVMPTISAGSLIVMLDASASMNATDVSITRFEAARASARSLIDALPGDARMTLIAVGPQPQVLASTEDDPDTLRRALDAAQPTVGSANWRASFALAGGTLGNSADQPTIVIISDGGLPSGELPPLPGEVRYVPIGQTGDNLAISAMAARPTASGAQLLVSVSNYGQTSRSAILSFYRDDVLFDSQQIDLSAGQKKTVVQTDLPGGSAIYEARLSRADGVAQPVDALSLDDAAFAVLRPSGIRRVLLVSNGNLFLEQMLAALPELSPYRATPANDDSLSLPNDPFDLYVFDGSAPSDLPLAGLLLVNPPSNSLFAVGATFTRTAPARIADHPLTRFVDWSAVNIAQARQVDPPDWASVLIDSEAGPLVFAGETGGRRVATLTFDLHDSDLPLRIAYPILFSNLVDYLAPARGFDAGDGLQPGDSLTIRPGLGVEQVVVAAPSGATYALSPSDGHVTFKDTTEPGVYAVNYLSANSQSADYFAVNLFDPGEANIRPAPVIRVGRTVVEPTPSPQMGQREVWPWMAAAALAVVLAEWWVYHRRQSLTPVVRIMKRQHRL